MNYEQIGQSIGKLVAEKNVAYGNSFHESCKIMELLYPKGIPTEKYKSVLALIRILDKIQRLVTDPNYNSENSWSDIAGYCILMMGDVEAHKKKIPAKEKVEFTIDPSKLVSKSSHWVDAAFPTRVEDMNNPELVDSGIGG